MCVTCSPVPAAVNLTVPCVVSRSEPTGTSVAPVSGVNVVVPGRSTSTRPRTTAAATLRASTGAGAADTEPGTNVTSWPYWSTAVHWLVDGHATATRSMTAPIGTGVELPGDAGSNVTSWPDPSTAVQRLADGHATPTRLPLASIAVGVGLPGETGSNVTSSPTSSTAVHWLADGHATATR
jgi:hypothetical protein